MKRWYILKDKSDKLKMRSGFRYVPSKDLQDVLDIIDNTNLDEDSKKKLTSFIKFKNIEINHLQKSLTSLRGTVTNLVWITATFIFMFVMAIIMMG